MDKKGNSWVEIKQVNKTIKEILILIMIVMNMQNKLYTTQFFSPPDDRPTASSPAVIVEHQTREFLRISHNSPKKNRTPRKVQTPGQDFEDKDSNLQKMRRADSCPPANPIHKLSMRFMVWNISTGQLGYPSGCAPPSSCTPAS